MTAIAQLVAAWRRTHDAALEPLIEKHTGQPIVEKTGAATEAAWHALAADSSDETTGRLLATQVASDAALVRRLEVLERRAPDPRITRWAAERARHYIYVQHDKLQQALARVIVRAPTAAIAEMIEALGNSVMVKHHRGAVRALAELKRTQAPQTLLVAPPKRAGSLDELWAQHRAQPFDRDHRRVLADALQAAGDPRGEFIALQLAPQTAATRKRIAELLRTHRDAWLGRLPWFKQDPPLFKDGFPAKLVVADESGIAPTLDAPEWITIEHLAIRRPDEPSTIATILKRQPQISGLEWNDAYASLGVWPQIRVLDHDARETWPKEFPNLDVRGGSFRDPTAIAKQATSAKLRVLVHTSAVVDECQAILATRDIGPPILGFTTSGTCVGNDYWSVRVRRGDTVADVSFEGTVNPYTIAQGPKIYAALAKAGITAIRLAAPKKMAPAPGHRLEVSPGALFDFSAPEDRTATAGPTRARAR